MVVVMHGLDSQKSILLAGGGGHALVVMETAQLAGQNVVGFFDDAPTTSRMNAHTSWLGRLDEVNRFPANSPSKTAAIHLAIGSISLRDDLLKAISIEYASVMHPTAIISAASQIGVGSFVGPGSVINANASIGAHAIINSRAVVEHDCRIDTNVHIAPGAVLGGGVCIGRNTLVGVNSTVKPNVAIGANCIVGAGAVVIADVYDGQVVAGVPARPITSSLSGLRLRKSA